MVFSAKCPVSFFAIPWFAFYLLEREFVAHRKLFSQERDRLYDGQTGWSTNCCDAQSMGLVIFFLHRDVRRRICLLLEYAVRAQRNSARLAGFEAGRRTRYP